MEATTIMNTNPLAGLEASLKLLCDHRAFAECSMACDPDAASVPLDCLCSPCGDSLVEALSVLTGAWSMGEASPEAQEKFALQTVAALCSPAMLLFTECMSCSACEGALDGMDAGDMSMDPATEACVCGSCSRQIVAQAKAAMGADQATCLNMSFTHCALGSETCHAALELGTEDQIAEGKAEAEGLCAAADAEAAVTAQVDPLLQEMGLTDVAYPPANKGKMCTLMGGDATSGTTAPAGTTTVGTTTSTGAAGPDGEEVLSGVAQVGVTAVVAAVALVVV